MEFQYELQGSSEIAGFLTLYLIIWLVMITIGLVSYVLRSLGMYTIARRRMLAHPWMAWVPVLDLWTLGSISDQYQYVNKGKNKNKRKWLIGLAVAVIVCFIAYYIMMIVLSFKVTVNSAALSEDQIISAASGLFTGFIIGYLVLLAVIIAMSVVRYLALGDLYGSSKPDHAMLFLVLSIVVGVTESFLIFACRKSDSGMPPKRPQPMGYVPGQYGYQPQPPMDSAQPSVYQPENVQQSPDQSAAEPMIPTVEAAEAPEREENG